MEEEHLQGLGEHAREEVFNRAKDKDYVSTYSVERCYGQETTTFLLKSQKVRQENGSRHELRVVAKKGFGSIYPARFGNVPNTAPVSPIGRHMVTTRTGTLFESSDIPVRVSIEPVEDVANQVELRVSGFNHYGPMLRDNFDLKVFKVEVESTMYIKIYENEEIKVEMKLSKDATVGEWKTKIDVHE